jgi:hypothetical protein
MNGWLSFGVEAGLAAALVALIALIADRLLRAGAARFRAFLLTLALLRFAWPAGAGGWRTA